MTIFVFSMFACVVAFVFALSLKEVITIYVKRRRIAKELRDMENRRRDMLDNISKVKK